MDFAFGDLASEYFFFFFGGGRGGCRILKYMGGSVTYPTIEAKGGNHFPTAGTSARVPAKGFEP